VEDVRLADLARAHGTPLFVYSRASMLSALAAYQRGFAGRKAKICYALKANSSLAVLQVFARAGCGFDIVSGGELERVLAAGAKASDIIFSGVGKSRREMRSALEAGIHCFNVESEPELDVLSQVATEMGVQAPVSLRVNPDVNPLTHPYISTGLKGNKFGIAHKEALHAYQRAASLPGLRVMASTATSARRSRRCRPTSMHSTACSTWSPRSRKPASRCSTSTSAAAWASSTTASSRRRPTRSGRSCCSGWTRAAMVTGSF
jgi:diaminopimelate decarboxylase